MSESPSGIVTSNDFELLLRTVRESVAVPAEGIFGPASISWKINRESALFLAAGRAALLQLAHPWVATAIADHSRTLHDPIGRFHRTCQAMFTITFAPTKHALATARRLQYRHATIGGSLREPAGRFPQNSAYEANELDALRWVYATLVDSAVHAYELLLPPLSQPECEQYYAESHRTAALFGIPPQALPPDWAAFTHYVDTMLQSDTLAVNTAAGQIAQQLNSGAGLPFRVPAWYGAVTTHLLPPRFRNEFQLPYSDKERRSAEGAIRWLRRLYRHLPSSLRFVGPYNEVRSRLRGKLQPTLPVRLSNKIWIGQPSLVGPTKNPDRDVY
jgi:uncharacterized protein (DUF2236 family)